MGGQIIIQWMFTLGLLGTSFRIVYNSLDMLLHSLHHIVFTSSRAATGFISCGGRCRFIAARCAHTERRVHLVIKVICIRIARCQLSQLDPLHQVLVMLCHQIVILRLKKGMGEWAIPSLHINLPFASFPVASIHVQWTFVPSFRVVAGAP